MGDVVQLTGEINLGQLMVVGSIIGSAVSIYLKSRLDVQRLTLSYKAVETDVVEIKSDLKALAINQQDIKLQLATLNTTAGFHSDISAAVAKLLAYGKEKARQE